MIAVSYYPPSRHIGGPVYRIPRISVWMTHCNTTVGVMASWGKRNVQAYIRLPRPIARRLKAAYLRRAEG